MNQIYFIGIGGIGMSALARYYHMRGYYVGGYDRINSIITDALEEEGIDVNFADSLDVIPLNVRNDINTLIVYTPAIPKDSIQLNYFRNNGYQILKRSEVLGRLSREHKAICVAGTHGKTTISTLLAYLLKESHVGCNAFLGGISTNYNTNVLLNDQSEYVVIEADEFDRSFLHLSPYISSISAMDADHLDIYGTKESMIEAFNEFADNTDDKGTIYLKYGLKLNNRLAVKYYGVTNEADFYSTNLRNVHGLYTFDYHDRYGNTIKDITLGIHGEHNVENATLAIAIATSVGVTSDEIKRALPLFKGIYRRFNVNVDNRVTYIDDYAHHPNELKAVLTSIRKIWPERKLRVCFQPHLYTRTRDFYKEFAKSLDIADEVYLLAIYPARELPINGVNSEMIARIMDKPCHIVSKSELLDKVVKEINDGVFVTVGAGDIDRLVPKIKEILSNQ